MIHHLKTLPEFFQSIKSGEKTFEIRLEDDRHYEAGDTLHLQEWHPEVGYTGDELYRDVPYLLRGKPYLPEGYVCMSLKEQNRV